ncbi:MAG: hypothetical protein J0G96_07090 [Flavobacteriia bacterium]|nr:hypothetical protein [Flavobacteriia bacterium]OJX36633.1 MAG: hypothetical protein BGO87_12600 [Flavobacteriia bacterium 40-80]
MQTSKNKIENKILKSPRGILFFAEDFTNYGTPENIRQVLSRLEKESVLVRLAHGIYVKPKIDPLLGTILPTAEHVAVEISKRDKSRIAPTGVLALNLLGLSTQVPMNAVYLTDGSQRIVKIGKRTIRFKKAAPRNFAIKDELLHLIVQAMKVTGQKETTDDFLDRIKPFVQKLNPAVIKTQLKYGPVWIQKEIMKLYKNQTDVD